MRARSLTAFDAQFLAAEAGNMTSNYCALGIFGPDANGDKLTAERVKNLIASRVDRIPALRWRLQTSPLGLDHPAFVDGDVDLDRHVIAHTLSAPGSEQQLAELTAEIMATRMDRRYPLWAFHVADGLEDGRVAVAMTFHHASADALAARMLMGMILDTSPERRDELPAPSTPAPLPRRRQRVARTMTRTATHPVRAARSGVNALPYLDQVPMMRTLPGVRRLAGAARAAKRMVTGDDGGNGRFLHAPRVRYNGPLSTGRAIAYGGVDLQLVKDVKNAARVSLNDVVVAAVGGGLRRRLRATDELPDTPLLAFVPVNTRAEQEDGKITNAISSFVVPVPTDKDAIEQRIKAAHEGMAQAKERHKNAPSTLLEDANELIFPVVFAPLAGGILRLMGTGVFSPPLNLVLSNVPGPPTPLYLDGAKMETVAPLSLVFDGVTLNITVVSYAGRLEIGIVGDRETVSDAWLLAADIEAEFASMHAALQPA